MQFLVGVLALAAVCQAVPEADPQLLLGPGGVATLPSFLPYAAANIYNPYFNVLPAPAPVVQTVPAVGPISKVITPVAPAPLVAPAVYAANTIIPQPHPYTPHDCVTAEGCAVRTLKLHGLAKREAEADAEADPEAFYGYAGYNPFYGYGAYNGFYGLGGYGPYGVNSIYHAAALGLGYATGYEGYPAATAPLLPAPVAAPAPFVRALPAPAPILRAAPVPAPLVRTIPAPVPVVKSVPATPLPVLRAAPVFAPAPLPAVRVTPPVAQPIVAESVKPVTYTHLGAHPIQPTTVLEKTRQVVGHHIF